MGKVLKNTNDSSLFGEKNIYGEYIQTQIEISTSAKVSDFTIGFDLSDVFYLSIEHNINLTYHALRYANLNVNHLPKLS